MPNLENDVWRWYHNVSECHYHIQITVKYRKVLIDKQVEQILIDTWKEFKNRYAIDIYTVGFDGDHAHILCQFLPKYSGGQVIKWIKSIPARQILKLPHIKQELWGGEFWTDGYYIATISNRGTRKIIETYVKNQGRKPEDVQLKLGV